MNFTYGERHDAAVKACNEWLSTKWGQHYQEMLRYLPEQDREEVRLMLQAAIRHAMSHRPSELITMKEVNRQYCNLLDSHKLDTYEAKMELFKNAAMQTETAATEAQREQAAAKAIQAQADAEAAFKQSIIDRQKQDAANKQVDIKELRRRALFSGRVNGRIQTTPMPASIKVVSRTTTPTAPE